MKFLASYFHFIVSLLMVLAAWKWGDWRNWQKYYPTMLFLALGNFIAGYITYNYSLWVCVSPLFNTTVIEFNLSFILFPATLLIFLPHFPKKSLVKQVGYILMWIIIYSIWEWFSCILECCKYYNGWSYWWSVAFNCVMFPLLWLHHKRPFWALLGGIALALFVIFYFDIPYSRMK